MPSARHVFALHAAAANRPRNGAHHELSCARGEAEPDAREPVRIAFDRVGHHLAAFDVVAFPTALLRRRVRERIRDLPREIRCVLNAGIHTLTAGRAVQVRGVTGERDASDDETLRMAAVNFEDASPNRCAFDVFAEKVAQALRDALLPKARFIGFFFSGRCDDAPRGSAQSESLRECRADRAARGSNFVSDSHDRSVRRSSTMRES